MSYFQNPTPKRARRSPSGRLLAQFFKRDHQHIERMPLTRAYRTNKGLMLGFESPHRRAGRR